MDVNFWRFWFVWLVIFLIPLVIIKLSDFYKIFIHWRGRSLLIISDCLTNQKTLHTILLKADLNLNSAGPTMVQITLTTVIWLLYVTIKHCFVVPMPFV